MSRTLVSRANVIHKDQIKGRVNEAKGKFKEVSGALVGNETMESKGKFPRGRAVR